MIAPGDFQGVIPRIAKFDGAYIISDRFRSQDTNTGDFVEALRAGAFVPDELERQSKGSAVRPGDFKFSIIFQGPQRLRWQCLCHKFTLVFPRMLDLFPELIEAFWSESGTVVAIMAFDAH